MNRKSVLTYGAVLIITILALYSIKTLDISYPLTITSTNRSSELAVVGEGRIDATPDTAEISVGINIYNSSSVDDVQKNINEVNNKIVTELKGLDIPKSDIKTSNYSIYPNYDQTKPEEKKYTGSAIITIRTKKIDIVSSIIQKATSAGANTINGVQYSIDNPSKIRRLARDKAIADAKAEAKRLAGNLGIKLGRITNIVEANQNDVYPMYTKSSLPMGGGGGEAQLEAGSQTVTSTVTLYFEKK